MNTLMNTPLTVASELSRPAGKSYVDSMILSELADAVGPDYVSSHAADQLAHSIDYYWIPEMWHDRGRENPKPDFIVHPGSAEEVAKVLRIANNYRIPVTLGAAARDRRAAHCRCSGESSSTPSA